MVELSSIDINVTGLFTGFVVIYCKYFIIKFKKRVLYLNCM